MGLPPSFAPHHRRSLTLASPQYQNEDGPIDDVFLSVYRSSTPEPRNFDFGGLPTPAIPAQDNGVLATAQTLCVGVDSGLMLMSGFAFFRFNAGVDSAVDGVVAFAWSVGLFDRTLVRGGLR